MKKQIQVEIELNGNGQLERFGPGSYRGGVPAPNMSEKMGFALFRSELDDNGIVNPLDGDGPYDGALQLNVYGTSQGYRELAIYLLALAELDTTEDDGFHVHHDGIASLDGKTHIDIILRKTAPSLSK